MTRLRFSLLIWLCWLPSAALGEPASADEAAAFGRVLDAIEIQGNTRTRDHVILRELEFAIGGVLERESVAESRQRLHNLRIFSSVAFAFDATRADGVRLTIRVEERWTAIPIAKFGSAGGTSFFTLGAFDINVLGRYLEAGAQYENLNGRNGGVTWFRNPRLFDQRLLFGYDLWFTASNRELFDADGDRESAFTFEKTRVHFFLEKELHRCFAAGAGIDYIAHDISNNSLSRRQRRANRDSNFVLPPSSKQTAFELSARVGRLNYDNFLVEGLQSEWLYRLAIDGVGSSETSSQLTVQNRAFVRFFENHNLGINLSLGLTSADLLQDQFYLGGLTEVRGYRDGQFVGSNFWRANVEYRVPSWKSKWLVVQHLAFFDIGNAGNSFASVFENESFSSLGIGLRLISPKVFRLNARIDYARTFGRDTGGAVSFGLQQFF